MQLNIDYVTQKGFSFMIEKFNPILLEHSIKNSIDEIKKFYEADPEKFIFISIKTSTLNDLSIQEITTRKLNGNIVLNVKHDILNGLFINQENNQDISESEIISSMSGRVLLSYNIDFVFSALLFNFKKSSSWFILEKLSKDKICLMKSLNELIKKEHYLKLQNACEVFHLDCDLTDNSVNKSNCILNLYNKMKPLIHAAETWMAGFKDINIDYLYTLKDGTHLCYWQSKDNEREILFTPSSVLGSERVAELNSNLKMALNNIGEVCFVVDKSSYYPDVKIHTLTKEEALHNATIEKNDYIKTRNTKLLNPKPPKGNKLRIKLSLSVLEANRKRIPKLNDNVLYQPFFKVNDILTIAPFIFDEGFNARNIKFIDSTGQSCGTLLNETDQWLRVLGLIINGFTAEIQIIEINKGVKVDVIFNKLK